MVAHPRAGGKHGQDATGTAVCFRASGEIALLHLVLLLAAGLSSNAWAQTRTAPHNLYSSTRDRADLATMRRLRSCGIQAVAEDSNYYEGLAPGLYVVISDPLPSATAAADQLARARACGVEGQTRMVRRRIAPD